MIWESSVQYPLVRANCEYDQLIATCFGVVMDPRVEPRDWRFPKKVK
jgi:hypothetical protein